MLSGCKNRLELGIIVQVEVFDYCDHQVGIEALNVDRQSVSVPYSNVGCLELPRVEVFDLQLGLQCMLSRCSPTYLWLEFSKSRVWERTAEISRADVEAITDSN